MGVGIAFICAGAFGMFCSGVSFVTALLGKSSWGGFAFDAGLAADFVAWGLAEVVHK